MIPATGLTEVPWVQRPVRFLAFRTGSQWKLILSCAEAGSPESGPRRLRTAVWWLCERDSRLCRKLDRGEEVELDASGGGRRAAAVVAPLFLDPIVGDQLFPYQRAGVAFLLQGRRRILADDMGLGKTVQALAAVRRLIRWGRVRWALIVVPSTLVQNWLSEAERFAPELVACSALERGEKRSRSWVRRIGESHLVVTTYEQVREVPEEVKGPGVPLVIADEAHRIRRPESRSHQGVRALQAERMWLLSGTPMERSAEDVTALMSLLEPKRFGVGGESLHATQLRSQIRPYVLRRSKGEVIDDLPDVNEQVHRVDMTDTQRQAYEKTIGEFSRRPAADFLALFNRLRSLADLDPDSGESGKLDEIEKLLSGVLELGQKALVFSQTLAPLDALESRLNQSDIAHARLDGSMALDERSEAVERFSSEGGPAVLLLSTGVGSEGLNLTAANHVLFVNRWWNPSANHQARDRVIRIGQRHESVFVHYLISRRTVEDRLEEILVRKERTFDELIRQLEGMDPSDILHLVQADAED